MLLLAALLAAPLPGQEKPEKDEGYEREELGVNEYTTPSIERVFEQLDELRPLPFQQLARPLPANSANNRDQKGLVFGGLIADGFLVVEAQKQNSVEDLGRVLIREARGLGVAEKVVRHSASLTDLGKTGKWKEMRKELIDTQADVEHAMIQLRDQRMAHLISLGGWLRGLEISAGAIAADFSAKRAGVMVQPDLLDYFAEEVSNQPPAAAQTALFQKLRKGVKAIRATLQKAPNGLQAADVQAVFSEAHDLNNAIRGE